jgi:hypothetical protein
LPHVEAEAEVAWLVVQNIAAAMAGDTRAGAALR